jgi:hypothetical protein
LFAFKIEFSFAPLRHPFFVQDIDFNAQGGNLRKHNISANPSVGCVYLWSWYAAAAVLLMTATCQKNLIMFTG